MESFSSIYQHYCIDFDIRRQSFNKQNKSLKAFNLSGLFLRKCLQFCYDRGEYNDSESNPWRSGMENDQLSYPVTKHRPSSVHIPLTRGQYGIVGVYGIARKTF